MKRSRPECSRPDGRWVCASMRRADYLRSFVAHGSCFIDIMMNVGIIFHAANRSSDQDLLRKAHRALPDDPTVSGARRRQHRARGHFRLTETGSSCARRPTRAGETIHRGRAVRPGRSMDLAPHTRFRGDERFLDAAQRCADFYIETHSGARGAAKRLGRAVPAPPYESSAAAIAASGLLQLAKLTAIPARTAVSRLCLAASSTRFSPPSSWRSTRRAGKALLKHGSYHQRRGLGVDESVMWGEYFLRRSAGQVAGR